MHLPESFEYIFQVDSFNNDNNCTLFLVINTELQLLGRSSY